MSVEDMSTADLALLITSLTEAEKHMMLLYIAGNAPEAFDRALAKVRPS